MYFHSLNPEEYQLLIGQYDTLFVVLSLLFACVASMTALAVNERSKKRSFVNRTVWMFLASCAMAFGIWSMQYISMFAYSLPIKVQFDPFFIVVSFIPTLLASFLAFYMINESNASIMKLLVSSALMSIGVTTMQMIGLASLRLDAIHSYQLYRLQFAAGVYFLGFFLLNILYQHYAKTVVRISLGVLIGLTVSIAYYIGMSAIRFYIPNAVQVSENTIPYELREIVTVVLIVCLVAMNISLFGWMFYDRFVMTRTKKYDTLTQLPNSHCIMEDLQKYSFRELALFAFDDMSMIYKMYGYHLGDEYILKIVERMKLQMHQSINMYRISQNQFIIATDKEDVQFEKMCDAILQSLKKPITIEESEIRVSAVCAYAFGDGTCSEELFNKTTSVIRSSNLKYDLSLIRYDATKHNTNIEDDLVRNFATAIEKEHMYLMYQPKMHARNEELAGFEALLRWNHPVHGFISPAIFVPMLEKNHKMEEVTNFIIEKVCQQIKQWREMSFTFKHVSINIPGNYVTSPQLIQVLDYAMTKYNVSANQIELEITETSFVQNIEQAMRAVNVFRERGFSVALDDFGTGLSSLSHLRHLRINTLKIDKAFIDHVPQQEKDSAILIAIMTLGHSLKLDVVFEGVEHEEQVRFINKNFMHPIIQGYYFAKPMFPYEIQERFIQSKVASNG